MKQIAKKYEAILKHDNNMPTNQVKSKRSQEKYKLVQFSMFEIGFPEVLVIAAITLVVVGPEKIPQLIKTVSVFFSKKRVSIFLNFFDEYHILLKILKLRDEFLQIRQPLFHLSLLF